MKTFRDYLIEFDSPTIYCDMDGVLADFVKFTMEHLGHKFSDDYWHELPHDLFYQLPPMSDAKILWNFIDKQSPPPFVLTAIPREGRGPISERAAQDKMKWMRKYFGVKEARIYAVKRIDKARFAKDGRDGRPNVLIDDHIKNINQFRAKGGIGIHHTSARNTIKELRKLGYK